jgi:hypothetical protein
MAAAKEKQTVPKTEGLVRPSIVSTVVIVLGKSIIERLSPTPFLATGCTHD